jgi:hypothetical protein
MNGPTSEPVALSVAIGGVLSTGVALAAVFLPGLDPTTQGLIIAFGNSLILAGSVIWARRQVFTKDTTQAIANAATFLPPGTPVDIGTPPTSAPNSTGT